MAGGCGARSVKSRWAKGAEGGSFARRDGMSVTGRAINCVDRDDDDSVDGVRLWY